MHRRAQHAKETSPRHRQGHRQRRHQQSHTSPIGGDLHGGRDEAIVAGGEQRRQKEPNGAPERSDGVGDAVNEHGPDTARPTATVEARRCDRKSVATKHRDPERHETHGDRDGRVLGVALDPRGEVVGHQADDDEHRHKAGGQGRAHHERTTHPGAPRTEITDSRRDVRAEEEHQIGRQKHEPARIHRSHETSEE